MGIKRLPANCQSFLAIAQAEPKNKMATADQRIKASRAAIIETGTTSFQRMKVDISWA